MPRGPKIDTKDMTPEQYEKKFGRKKPGPKGGAARKVKAKATVRAAKAGAGLKKDGTPRKKPGPKAGAAKKMTVAAKPKNGVAAPYGFKKDGTPRKPPGRKAGGAPKQEIAGAVTVAGRRGPGKAGTKSGRAAGPRVGAAEPSGGGPGKDLGPPPPSRARQYQLVKDIVENDLDDGQLTELSSVIEEKLIGDISDLDSDDLGAVAELQSSGYSKLGAIKTVRKDKAEVAQANAAAAEDPPEENEEGEEAEETTATSAVPGEDDVDEEDGEPSNTDKGEQPVAAAPTS